MAQTNHQRVGVGIELLGLGLRPYVERELRAKKGDEWLARKRGAPGADGGPNANAADPSLLLGLLLDNWDDVFRAKLARGDRNYIFEARDYRNRWAHNEPFPTDEAHRALDTFQRVLKAVGAADQAIELENQRHSLLRQKFEEESRAVRRKAAKAEVAPQSDTTTAGLPPWRTVAVPHDDVAQGSYELAQFAADLHQVWRGDAEPEYGDPTELFRRTFITAGMRDLLVAAVRRLSGRGGEPIIALQTNFGGGKTHSLIALYHLFSGRRPTELPGVEQLLTETKLSLPPGEVRRAVLAGDLLEPAKTNRKPDGTEVHTLWGELAWQLGGADAYDLVAEADRAGVSPGEALIDLLEVCSPCLVLIDEWVAHARQLYGLEKPLPAGSFEAQFSFAQALTQAARSVSRAQVVVTIPESDIEVGGEGGKAALIRIENVVGRTKANWRTATTEESFEIVRRRLFKDLSAEEARQRDAVARAFVEMYRNQSGDFPFDCRDSDYERRMKAAYPIHPELFDRLFGEWSELERFQRTRGVLRLMAKVVHRLWVAEDGNLLIMPGSLPVADSEVAAELGNYLEDGWAPVIETDVDGEHALPVRQDKQYSSGFGRLRASRRVARTVYFGTAPSQLVATRGLDDSYIKLGCVQPGERAAAFGDALRRLADQATYLYRDGGRYWFSRQPTVTRLAQDRASTRVTAAQVEDEIRARLDRSRRASGAFAKVHTAPRSPADVPDEDAARLVVLGPEHTHDNKSEHSPGKVFAERVLAERAGGARRWRNMLVFLAADSNGLSDLRQAVRQWLAWRSVDDDHRRGELELDPGQQRQVGEKLAETDQTIDLRLSGTYQWVINPTQSKEDPTGPVRWETIQVKGTDELAERVSERLVPDEVLVPALGGSVLRREMERVPLWRGDHVDVNQLWDDFCQYLYLPRLVRREVLEQAIEQGVMSLVWHEDGFGYADGHDGERYMGLIAVQRPAVVAPSGLLVKPDVAQRQLDEERGPFPPPGDPTHVHPPVHPPGPGGTPAGGPAGGQVASPGHPSHYYGRVTLDSARWTRSVVDIAEAIVDQLARAQGASVNITIEVEADAADGFDPDVQRTVSENADVLMFDTSDFEDI